MSASFVVSDANHTTSVVRKGDLLKSKLLTTNQPSAPQAHHAPSSSKLLTTNPAAAQEAPHATLLIIT